MSPTTIKTLRVIGYVRVSTNRQEVGPEVQAKALTDWADMLGTWDLDIRREDAASAKSMDGRPVLAQALADLKAGRADMLAVSKLDRLSRSVKDFATILDDADKQGWHVACLDLGVDTSTTMGRGMAHMTAVFAEMERRRIGERTKEAMARIKAETGKHMGRPSGISVDAVLRATELYALDLSLKDVADQLNEEGIPTPTGGRWWPDRVVAALDRAGVTRRPRGRRSLPA